MRRRRFLKVLAGAGAAAACAGGGGMLFLRTEAFGALPEGQDLARILRSAHQTGGVFRNLEPAPVLAGGQNFAVSLVRWLFRRTERPVPAQPLPVRRPDFGSLEGDVLVWLGHSSFYLQLAGRRLLIDPVFSGYASPVFFANKAFPGPAPCTAADLPPIDCLLISHDHWDHLDYPSIMALRPKIGQTVCGLGTGAHLRRWGFDRERVHEADWGESLDILPGLRIHLTSSRHFSGRSLGNHDRALWCGFVLETARRRILFSGDGGYGRHFQDIGRRFGSFDLVLLDTGQYNANWPTVHMFPEEAVRAAEDLRAKAFLPAHVGRFCLSVHSWDEPFVRCAKACEGRDCRLVTPVMGEPLRLEENLSAGSRWWEGLV